jgi:long-chain acyl-CoA synthetase
MPELGFWKIAAERPDYTAIIEPDGNEVRSKQLLAGANQLVHGLRGLGLQKRDCIATLLPNGAQMLEICLAATQAGWYVTPINWHLTATEIAYIMKDCGAKAFVCDERFAAAGTTAADEVGVPAGGRFATGHIAGFRPISELKDGQPETAPEDRSAGAVMTYTSGTTGQPKGVRRQAAEAPPEPVASQQALFLALFGIMPGSPGVHLAGAPLYHTAVVQFSQSHLHLGQQVVLMDKWTGEGCLQAIERYRVTSSHMVPTQFHRLLKLPDEVKKRYDVSSLTHIIHSAAPCPVETKYAMLDWWGPCIYEYYAASEGGGTLVTPEQWVKRPGTVGLPWPISQIRVLDDDNQPCEPNTPGTVWIRMGDYKFEYHGDKAKTDEAWNDGFFTVGDAGYLDEEGYLFLCDRKADLIISGGVNIYPAEIESVLILHPKVADVAVFGVPDDDWGESVKAVVQPIEGQGSDEELRADLRAFCQDKLAKYKQPRSIDFALQLPRDPNGKLYKRKLRDPYWEGRDRAI